MIMDADFWLQKWEKNDIAFHGSEANPLLVEYFKLLSLEKGSRVFLPLCGKTLDIAWLLANGYRVAGAELSEMAVEQLFVELGTNPKITKAGKVKHYGGKDIDIFVGDIFDLPEMTLGPVDAIYDRAALVALPEKMRGQYAEHLTKITSKAPQFLICYEYDQDLMKGPPFSVDSEEVNQRYEGSYDLRFVASKNVIGGLKGCPAKETVWLLLPEMTGICG